MIKVKDLKKRYKNTLALCIKELEIIPGESVGLVGNNGAGKTTFMNLILDLVEATEGKVYSKNVAVSESEEWKKYTGSYLDEGFLIDFLTPCEYFHFVGKLYGLNPLEIEDFFACIPDFFEEEILKDKKLIRNFSKGNKSKIGIMGALLGNPEVVILDEPFAHLDPGFQIKLRNILKSHQENNKTTFLISSHDLKQVTEICDRIILIDKGEIKKDIKTTKETLADLENFFAV